MNSINELATDLGAMYKELRAGTVDIKMAGELNNTAGKIMKAYALQVAYHALRDEAPNIPFLAAESALPKRQAIASSE